MTLPPQLRNEVESKLKAYAERKIPTEMRNKIRLSWEFRGDTVTLYEERLRRAGIDPERTAKAHLEAQARGLTAEATLSRLETFSRPAPEPIECLIRSIREEH